MMGWINRLFCSAEKLTTFKIDEVAKSTTAGIPPKQTVDTFHRTSSTLKKVEIQYKSTEKTTDSQSNLDR